MDNGNCNKGRGKDFISVLRSLRIWDVAGERGEDRGWPRRGTRDDSVGRNIAGKIHFLEISYNTVLWGWSRVKGSGRRQIVSGTASSCEPLSPLSDNMTGYFLAESISKVEKSWRILFFELLMKLIFHIFPSILILKFVSSSVSL